MSIREKVLSSFKTGYSQVIPFRYSNYIDGLFHISMLCGAAHIVGDKVVWSASKKWITQLLELSDEARNFAPIQVGPDWEPCDGWWIKRKKQSFAGPAALWWASEYTELPLPFNPIPQAEFMVKFGWLFGWLNRFDLLNQHMNSIFMAYMVLRKRPPASMKWLAYDNPFYLWIYGEKWEGNFPGPKMSGGEVQKTTNPVAFSQRAPGSWPAKNRPNKMYFRRGDPVIEYTPICELICSYLQGGL